MVELKANAVVLMYSSKYAGCSLTDYIGHILYKRKITKGVFRVPAISSSDIA